MIYSNLVNSAPRQKRRHEPPPVHHGRRLPTYDPSIDADMPPVADFSLRVIFAFFMLCYIAYCFHVYYVEIPQEMALAQERASFLAAASTAFAAAEAPPLEIRPSSTPAGWRLTSSSPIAEGTVVMVVNMRGEDIITFHHASEDPFIATGLQKAREHIEESDSHAYRTMATTLRVMGVLRNTHHPNSMMRVFLRMARESRMRSLTTLPASLFPCLNARSRQAKRRMENGVNTILSAIAEIPELSSAFPLVTHQEVVEAYNVVVSHQATSCPAALRPCIIPPFTYMETADEGNVEVLTKVDSVHHLEIRTTKAIAAGEALRLSAPQGFFDAYHTKGIVPDTPPPNLPITLPFEGSCATDPSLSVNATDGTPTPAVVKCVFGDMDAIAARISRLERFRAHLESLMALYPTACSGGTAEAAQAVALNNLVTKALTKTVGWVDKQMQRLGI